PPGRPASVGNPRAAERPTTAIRACQTASETPSSKPNAAPAPRWVAAAGMDPRKSGSGDRSCPRAGLGATLTPSGEFHYLSNVGPPSGPTPGKPQTPLRSSPRRRLIFDSTPPTLKSDSFQ